MTIETNRGKVTATKNILNYISLLACEAADKYRQDGANALAQEAELFSDMIYEVLKESGLYND